MHVQWHVITLCKHEATHAIKRLQKPVPKEHVPCFHSVQTTFKEYNKAKATDEGVRSRSGGGTGSRRGPCPASRHSEDVDSRHGPMNVMCNIDVDHNVSSFVLKLCWLAVRQQAQHSRALVTLHGDLARY